MATDDLLRLVQVFLSRRGFEVFHVSFDGVADLLVCTCPGYDVRGRCKHVRWVRARIQETGRFDLHVPLHAVPTRPQSPEEYRDMVLRYSTPVVLP